MKSTAAVLGRPLEILFLTGALGLLDLPPARSAPAATPEDEIRIVQLQGKAEMLPAGANNWVLTTTTQVLRPGDQLRTLANSRVLLRWSDQSTVSFGPMTTLEILPPHDRSALKGLRLLRGLLSFFHRDEPGRIRVITRGAVAGVEGTEFVMQVASLNNADQTTISVIDGTVRFSNPVASLLLTNGQQAVAQFGVAPQRTPGFIANNVLQWAFYYPGVLDLQDLPLAPPVAQALAPSLAAYRAGDLLAALAQYPAGRQPASDAERIYLAAVLLSVGQVEQTEALLAGLPPGNPANRLSRLARALRLLIAAVKRQPLPAGPEPELPSELLAASYYEQSRAVRGVSLERALELAREAAARSPGFSFALARVAELEFSFGQTRRALAALDRSLALAPRNAQALALKGFLLAAHNRTREAIDWFNRALAVDPALGNAWLGRGLCRIRRGDVAGGREDLLIAAASEPQRALLRSYLGKAYEHSGNFELALKELALAKRLDPADPTAWLYSALVLQQLNRINEGIRELERSQELNNNRRVYRSSLLLDQDQGVRSANLDSFYQEAGLNDVSVREAGRAVAVNYYNYSAHLHLANSYEDLRRSSLFQLRFESAAFNEYLLTHLMGPADGRLLALVVNQQEYQRLFQRDGLGVHSFTEYLSRGAWRQVTAAYGTYNNFGVAFQGAYDTDPGEGVNRDLESLNLNLRVKHMVTPNDGLLLQVIHLERSGGDLTQYRNPASAVEGLRFDEQQDASVLAGWDHVWNPQHRTLLLGSYFNDRLSAQSPRAGLRLIGALAGTTNLFAISDAAQVFANNAKVGTVELQHIARTGPFQTVAGMRLQGTDFDLKNRQTIERQNAGGYEVFLAPSGRVVQNRSLDVQAHQISGYLYEHWQIWEPLTLIGGFSADYVRQPKNISNAPLNTEHESLSQVSPKAGLLWTPNMHWTLRGAYTRSLGGTSLGQSLRLEPTQVAGFIQTFRSLMPESLVGGVNGARFETAAVSLEWKGRTGTYVAVSAESLWSAADQTVGTVFSDPWNFTNSFRLTSLKERLRFRERSLTVSVDQLLGEWWSIGAGYRLSQAELSQTYPQLIPGLCQARFSRCPEPTDGLLHQVSLHGQVNHPSGFYAGVYASWWEQDLSNELGDSFWEVNLWAGYRFARRRVNLSVGLLNALDTDYRLGAINFHAELPRHRTFATRLEWNF